MLATVINGMVVRRIEDKGMFTRLQTVLKLKQLLNLISKEEQCHLEKEELNFGRRNWKPYFTDTAAVSWCRSSC
jgi:uridylate kinase